jgi:hypothetical protein
MNYLELQIFDVSVHNTSTTLRAMTSHHIHLQLAYQYHAQ